MKKIYLSLLGIIIYCQFGYSQNTFPASGNVGIGISTPTSNLQIGEASDSKPGGVTAATKSILKFSRYGTPNYSYNESAEFRIGHGGPNVWGSQLDLFINGAANINGIPDQQVMTWLYNGNVGIGTTTPDPAYKLSVNGSIRTKEVKVEAGWSDYVFDKGYTLKPLTEVADYISKNKHLPDVPSAAEVEKNGVKVGETEALLLKKIEELTLYMIQLKKENNIFKKQIEEMQNYLQVKQK